ncbi:MAG: hypothetical protein R2812_04035 [Gelidibacter sp.]
MKTKFIVILSIVSMTLCSFTSEKKAIVAVYDGHEDYGYNFIATHDDDDSEYTITFQEVDKTLLKTFDLDSETLIGKKFEITYESRIETTTDENGFDDEQEILTITNLKSL